MSIAQRGKKWVVSLGSGKERIRASFSTLVEARNYEVDLTMKKLGVTQQEVNGTPEGTLLSTLKILTAKAIWSNSRSDEALQRNAQQCIDFLGDIPVAWVNAEKLRNLTQHYIDSGNSGGTINRKMSALSVMLKYAVDQGLTESLPRVPRRRESEHRIRFMTPKEEQTALAYCEHRGLEQLADFIACAIDTGFRRRALLRLQLSDCVQNYAVQHAGTTKSGKAISVPLTKRVRAVVEKCNEAGHKTLFQGMSDSQLRTHWEGLKDHMKMNSDDQFVVHMLRHTCASRLAQAGKNATFIQSWMGHSSIMVTQRYMHLAPKALEGGLEALEAFQQAA